MSAASLPRIPPLERVFRDATDPILIEDLDGRVLDLNREAVETYGFARDEIVGRPILTIVPEERHGQAQDLLRRCRRGESVRDVEGLRRTKGGEVVPVLLTLSLLRDEAGDPAAVATFAKDIRQLKRVEHELLDAKRKLEDRVAERTAHLHDTLRAMQETNRQLEHEIIVARELTAAASQGYEVTLVGESVAARALREAVVALGRLPGDVLISGPAGSGHEAVARAIHLASERRARPFIKVNCAQLDGAQRDGASEHDGEAAGGQSGSWAPESTLEVARGGTLYLQYVDRLPPEVQPALTRWLVGRKNAGPSARVMASLLTTTEAGSQSADEALSSDLATALGTFRIRLPPLVDRRDDLPDLVDALLRRHAGATGRVVDGVTPETLARFAGYDWPGNLSELDSLLGRAVMRATGPRVDVPAALLRSGDEVGGYHLVEKIGEGGMGEVWRGTHALLARPAAVKLIRPRPRLDAAGRRALRERFEREARVTASLRSPHTVELYDFGGTPDGRFYYVMEYLDGLDLHHALHRWGPMPAGRVLHLWRQACASLTEAHEAGLFHRDITAANLFVCRLGGVYDFLKVLDFGVVRDQRAPTDEAPQTWVPGTPVTMAPETIDGREDADHRADLYALGCVAYWMLTHRYPFEGKTSEAIWRQHRNALALPPSAHVPGVPRALDRLVTWCLEKRPEDRPHCARTLGRRVTALSLEHPWREDEAEAAWWVAEEHRPDADEGVSEDVGLTRWNGVTRVTAPFTE
ncbi:MAG: protein kinase [Myxococcota bacterium]